MAEIMVENYRNMSCKMSKEEIDAMHKEIGDKRVELCKRLGFQHQVTKVEPKEGAAGKFYPELSEEELKVWDWFCPGIYRHENSNGFRGRGPIGQLCYYNFDTIPAKVLEELEFAKSLEIFDEVQIWTPEKRRTDPVLLGVIGNHVHLIARWGESLQPFIEIQKRYQEFLAIKDKYEKLRSNGESIAGFSGVGIAVIIFALLFLLNPFSHTINLLISTIALSLTIAFLAFGIISKIIDDKKSAYGKRFDNF